MSDPVSRLNAALEGRYAIERELGEGLEQPLISHLAESSSLRICCRVNCVDAYGKLLRTRNIFTHCLPASRTAG